MRLGPGLISTTIIEIGRDTQSNQRFESTLEQFLKLMVNVCLVQRGESASTTLERAPSGPG